MKAARWLGMSLFMALGISASTRAQDALAPMSPIEVAEVKKTPEDGKSATKLAEPAKNDKKPVTETAAPPKEEKKAEEWKEEKWGPPLPESIKWMEDCNFGQCLKKHNIRMYGWLETGYTYSNSGPGQLEIEPRLNRFGNEFIANQLAVVVEKQLDKECWDWGFNVTYWSGADPSTIQPKGGLDSPPENPRFSHDFRQLYLSAHAPILTEGGVDIKVGRMGTVIGYNSALAPYRPFYSIDYQWFYFQDGAFTGAMATWHVNDQLDVIVGATLGANTFFTKRSENSYCPLLQVNYFLTEEKKTMLSASLYMGENAIFSAPGLAGNWVTMAEARIEHTWNKYLDQIVQADLAWDRNVPGRGDTGSWSAWNTFRFHLSQEIDLNLRGEWFRDQDGTRTGIDATYGELTLGFDYHPCKSLRIRPEVRGDFADRDTFDDGTRRRQLTAAVDFLIQF